MILLAENDEGYHNLMKLVSLGHLEGFYYKPRIDKDILRQYSKGIICMSACIAGEIPVQILRGNLEGAENSLKDYLDIFGKDNFFLEIQDHDLEEMYLDSFLTIAFIESDEDILKAIEKLDIISEKYKVRFILSVSKDKSALPECAKAKVVVSL